MLHSKGILTSLREIFSNTSQENAKLESVKPWWITWILAEKTHFFLPDNGKTSKWLYPKRRCSQLTFQKVGGNPYKKRTTERIALRNYRSTSSLNLLWKILTGTINEKGNSHLNQQNLLLEEQEGCQQRARGAKD